ncbi:hypothetical protein GCM10009853_032070 [Glycomyces scopariae]
MSIRHWILGPSWKASTGAIVVAVIVVGISGPVTNTVPLWVGIPLGLAAAVATSSLQVLLDRRAERKTREFAWEAAVTNGPSVPSTDDDEDGLITLLLPEQSPVRFSQTHAAIVRQLRRWAAEPGARPQPVICLTGDAGGGKTRVLLEVSSMLAEQGVRCGWVPEGHGPDAVEAAVAFHEPVLLIVDNASTHPQLVEILTCLQTKASSAVTVVLAARDFGDWWRRVQMRLPREVLGLVVVDPDLRLPPAPTNPKEQQQVFEQARRAFGGDAAAAVELAASAAPSMLLIHAAALLAATSTSTPRVDPGEVVTRLFALEEAQWVAALGHHGGIEVLRAAVLLATLVGAETAADAEPLLLHHLGLAAQSHRWRQELIVKFRARYPQEYSFYLAPHLPGLLAEYYTATYLAAHPTIANAVEAAALATTDPQMTAARIVGILGQAAHHTPAAETALRAVINHNPGYWLPAAINAVRDVGVQIDQILAAAIKSATLDSNELTGLIELIPQSERFHRLGGTALAVMQCRAELANDEEAKTELYLEIAKLLDDQGRFREAEQVLQQARNRIKLDSHETTSQSERLQTGTSSQTVSIAALETSAQYQRILGQLAVTLEHQERLKEAERLYGAVLQVREERLGADHPDTLITRNNLAGVLYKRGRWDEAERLYRAVLQVREERLGADHPDTLSTRHNLANLLHKQGHLSEAEVEARAAFTRATATLRDDDPIVEASRHTLTRVLRSQGRVDEAEQIASS